MTSMKSGSDNSIRIVELHRTDTSLPLLNDKYTTDAYYDLSIKHETNGWTINLILKQFEKPIEKTYTGKFFEPHIEEPRVYAARLKNEQAGWIELGYDRWNNRMRIWELLVKKNHRTKGIGTKLIKHAIDMAKQKGARMLVLETQSDNATAIRFYLKQGFNLIGFDVAAYTNEDTKRKEIRLEFGLPITSSAPHQTAPILRKAHSLGN